jgi:cell division protein FtsB
MSDARADLARVESEVAELRADLELLQTDAEIERLAREDFDLVYPGEESYRIVPGDDGG